jgi:hypothetical protein
LFTEANIAQYVGQDFSIETTNFLNDVILFDDLPLSTNLFSDEYLILTSIQAFDQDDLTLPNYQHNNYYDFDFAIQFKVTDLNYEWTGEPSQTYNLSLIPTDEYV